MIVTAPAPEPAKSARRADKARLTAGYVPLPLDNLAKPETFWGGHILAGAGRPLRHVSLLLEGFVFHVLWRDEKRAIVGLNVPGDIVEIEALTGGDSDFDYVAAGTVRVARSRLDRVRSLLEDGSATAHPVSQLAALSSAIQRRWLFNCQTMKASQVIAHLYAEIRYRLGLAGRTVGHVLRTPFTQTDIADMCGVTPIHANRAISELRQQGLAEIRRGDLYTSDWKALERYARFDPAYLMPEPSRRPSEP